MDTSRTLKKFPVVQHALVVGGGLAGAKAAADIAARGIPVTLIETADALPVFAQPCAVSAPGAATTPKTPAQPTQTPEPPGRKASQQLGGDSGREQLLAFLSDRLQSGNKVRVLTSTTVSRVRGRVGDFTVELTRREPAAAPEKERGFVQEELRVGAIVVALEGPRLSTKELAALRNGKNVLGMGELCAAINFKAHLPREVFSHGETLPHRVAFLLAPPPASSKDSTARALEMSALFRRRLNIEVFVFLNSLQVAERELEEKYHEGRKSGVLFFPYSQLPEVRVSDKEIAITHKDIFATDSPGSWTCDLLVIDEKASPGWEADWPTRMFNSPSDHAGFFSSSNPTVLPAESGRKGVFVVGNSRANSSVEESMAEASAAAAGVSALLAMPEIEAETHATVDPQKCALCLTCVRVCPHSAIDYGEYPEHKRSAAKIYDAACIGCGICVGECPARAIELTAPAPAEKTAKTLVLCCKRSAQQAREALAAHKWAAPNDICFVEVPCAGRVDTGLILKAFETGHGHVLVLGCHEDACKSFYGNTAAQRRVDYLKKSLPALGVSADRLEMRRLAASQVELLAAVRTANLRLET